MANPGTAYDNPILGKDPQPATMAGYVPGGNPHLNSGIVNRWFYLMAIDLGMDAAARIWYATLQESVVDRTIRGRSSGSSCASTDLGTRRNGAAAGTADCPSDSYSAGHHLGHAGRAISAWPPRLSRSRPV